MSANILAAQSLLDTGEFVGKAHRPTHTIHQVHHVQPSDSSNLDEPAKDTSKVYDISITLDDIEALSNEKHDSYYKHGQALYDYTGDLARARAIISSVDVQGKPTPHMHNEETIFEVGHDGQTSAWFDKVSRCETQTVQSIATYQSH